MSAISILHLEDSDLDADLIRAWLVRDGFDASIDRAAGREEFTGAVTARSYDLILADYSLPNFDGLTALEIAREAAPDTPFLFVSGMLGEEVAIETLKRGATDYVLKQRLGRLAPAVRRALAEAHERAERRKAETALREEEVRHRLVIDSITDYAVITTDTAGRIQTWSAGAERVFGYTEPQVVGRTLDPLFTPEDVQAGVPRAQLERAGLGCSGDDERWYVRHDGSLFWGSGVLARLVDDDGRHLGYTKVVRDVTDRKRAEDALREADRRKDEFLAMLAHELRNPLSAIGNAVHLARRTDLSPERQAWTKEVIEHQVRHLAHLVDDLLDVSRITRGKIQLRKELIPLSEVVNRAVEATRPFIDDRGHELTVSLGPGPVKVEADPTRLEQVLVNLLTNAAKYTEPGGHIALTAAREGGAVVVRVKDDGIGMSPELVGRVFDLFTQADNSLDRSKGGLGIGLTIASKLVEMHGGVLKASSDGPGLGSEFRLSLPAVRDPAPRAAGGPPCRSDSAPGIPASRILVVDDNVQTASLLAELLRGLGHDVATAHDGAEALEAARRQKPEILLLDIGLPVLDGYQVASRLRADEELRQVLIVGITGYGEDQALRRSREAGFDHHLVKPVDFDRLLAVLATSFGRAPSRAPRVEAAAPLGS